MKNKKSSFSYENLKMSENMKKEIFLYGKYRKRD